MMIRAVAFAAAFLLAGAALAQTPSGTDTPAVEAAPAEPKQGTEAPAEGTAPAEAEAEPSARPGGKPPVPEFQRRSGQRSGGPANDLNTPDSRARERLPGGSVTDTVTGRDLYHGNYCGRGNRGNGLPPVDELDAVCQRHDECYDAAQRPSCACDRALRRDAIAIADASRFSRELRARAASIAEAAEVMRCQNP
jgi:hypothetical protein